MPFWLEIVINVVFSYLASAGFALTINVPHRALNFSGISGVVAWMAYWFCFRAGMGRMLSNLLGAFLIGILSLFFARIKKCPVAIGVDANGQTVGVGALLIANHTCRSRMHRHSSAQHS